MHLNFTYVFTYYNILEIYLRHLNKNHEYKFHIQAEIRPRHKYTTFVYQCINNRSDDTMKRRHHETTHIKHRCA